MVGTLVYRKRTEASGRKRGGGRARCQILRVSSPREKPCHSLPSLFFSTSPFLHFPRSSGASIINPNVVWPWPWPLIPMRACDARIPEGQRLSLLAGSQKPSSLSRHPRPPSVIPARHQRERTRVGSAGQEILVPQERPRSSFTRIYRQAATPSPKLQLPFVARVVPEKFPTILPTFLVVSAIETFPPPREIESVTIPSI